MALYCQPQPTTTLVSDQNGFDHNFHFVYLYFYSQDTHILASTYCRVHFFILLRSPHIRNSQNIISLISILFIIIPIINTTHFKFKSSTPYPGKVPKNFVLTINFHHRKVISLLYPLIFNECWVVVETFVTTPTSVGSKLQISHISVRAVLERPGHKTLINRLYTGCIVL